MITELSTEARKIYSQICQDNTKLGDLRKIAKEIKKDHSLGMELWGTGNFMCRQLAILLFDKKLLTQELLDMLFGDMEEHPFNERTQLSDWLMANQLSRDKKTIALMENWEDSPSVLQRRLFWYYQARLRWTGQTPPPNTSRLLEAIDEKIQEEDPEVQWAMNFTAAWIGIFDHSYRARCIAMGEKFGLYRDEKVSRGCTPNYLPEFIRIEVGKRK
ncbi:DNA alkylation repair protein [Zeaxanthinibacter enoshimensis]|uniref:DNA alkylation repair enzyme n=1 Tax=Zeaxanthinibacter enoshimensis TaxID=392009 RepID=A0A4R6TLJ7_9FLAO|nr:DNA alkylation repair protein [Zeaxanthinibacter enoshimensis]TDQ32234.1 DNA alkylation repair enzyme [Zeaxanthinibacter enoshimensis]